MLPRSALTAKDRAIRDTERATEEGCERKEEELSKVKSLAKEWIGLEVK